MAAIAYITDSKMLEIHRIDRRQELNFWRLSSQINFREFEKGDLLFFLSKDRHWQRNREKAIVGYGRAEGFLEASPDVMWKRYGVANGYDTRSDFKKAIVKVSREHILPKKISSIYLVDVNYFQTPAYLSDYGMNLNVNIESFCYLKQETIVSFLKENIGNIDSWSQTAESARNLRREIARQYLYEAQKSVKDFPLSELLKKRFRRRLKKAKTEHPYYAVLPQSLITIYYFSDEKLNICFLKDSRIDLRYYLGQRELLQKRYAVHETAYPLCFHYLNDDNTREEM